MNNSNNTSTTSKKFTTDQLLLFLTRFIRLFAYGFLSVVLVLYLSSLGMGEGKIGLLLSLTLVGDTVIALWISTVADRFGRRRMLALGALLMIGAGAAFVMTREYWLLVLAATIGVISPSGNEVGPFLPIEQAALSQMIPAKIRTRIFAWYSLTGAVATALGSLFGGSVAQLFQHQSFSPESSYRIVIWCYVIAGVFLLLTITRLSSAAEIPEGSKIKTVRARFGLHKSQRIVMKLSALFALDAFGGGFILQSFFAYWFYIKFNVQPGALGGIFFGANILAGISQLVAARVAEKFGLINTMVFTHLPSHILLMLVALMPNVTWAVVLLFIRYSISQMDVPTRQSYTMAVVSEDERSAAAGITGVARTIGASLSPVIAGLLLSNPALISVPLFLAGGIKIIYDLALYRSFTALKPPEEISQ